MLHIRDATAADAPALCTAEQAVVRAHDGLLVSLPEELHEAAFLERIVSLADGRGKYLVVSNGAELLAHACLWPMGLRNVSHVFRLDMCVHLGHWHQGHGRALLGALLAWARTNPSALKVELLVRSTNLPAISLYRQFSFVEEGRLHRRIRLHDGRFIDDLCMALDIEHDAG
jgi:putative acetyltransferase